MSSQQEIGEHIGQPPMTPRKPLPSSPMTRSTTSFEELSPLIAQDHFVKFADPGSPTLNRKRHNHTNAKSKHSDLANLESDNNRSEAASIQEGGNEATEAKHPESKELLTPGLGIFLFGDEPLAFDEASADIAQDIGNTRDAATSYDTTTLAQVSTTAIETSTALAQASSLVIQGSSTPLSNKGLRTFPPEIRDMIFRRAIDRRETAVIMPSIIKALIGEKDLLAEAIRVHQRKRIYYLKLANKWNLDRYSDSALTGMENLSISFYCCPDFELYRHLNAHLKSGHLQQLVSFQISIRNFIQGGGGYLSGLLHLFLEKCLNLQYIFVRSNAKILDADRYLEEITRKLGRGGWLTRVVAGHEHIFQAHGIEGIADGTIVEMAGLEGQELKWCWYSEVGWGREWANYLREREQAERKRFGFTDTPDDDDVEAETEREHEDEGEDEELDDEDRSTEDEEMD